MFEGKPHADRDICATIEDLRVGVMGVIAGVTAVVEMYVLGAKRQVLCKPRKDICGTAAFVELSFAPLSPMALRVISKLEKVSTGPARTFGPLMCNKGQESRFVQYCSACLLCCP